MNTPRVFRLHAISTGVKAVSAIALVGAALSLAGCNTTAGAGQDVSAAGHAVSNTAEKVKQGI